MNAVGKMLQTLIVFFRQKTFLYCLYHRLRFPSFMVRRSSEFVIEGYPRSGNSFLEAYLRLLVEGKKKNEEFHFGHHVHSAAQVRLGVRLKKPVVVLIRNPEDAVVSNFLYRNKKWNMEVLLREYLLYYEEVKKVISGVSIVDFCDLTFDSSLAVSRVCDTIGFVSVNKGFSKERIMHIVEEISVSRKTQEKNSYTDERYSSQRYREKEVAREVYQSLSGRLRRRADGLYEGLRSYSNGEGCVRASPKG